MSNVIPLEKHESVSYITTGAKTCPGICKALLPFVSGAKA